jgi:N-acyl-D-aspartate/D-glutamate deacylase
MDAELVIKGGTVVDGTGSAARRADVAVRAGRVVAVGEGLTGAEVIDATGRMVTPGFFDIHTHYDAQVFWDPALTSSCWHGVTSVVAGNCGFSLAPTREPQRGSIVRTLQAVEDMSERMLNAGIEWSFETFGEYLSAVERRGTILNFGCYVGHSPVRLFVMGDEGYEREATPDEISRMRAVVAEAGRAPSASPRVSRPTIAETAAGRCRRATAPRTNSYSWHRCSASSGAARSPTPPANR